MLESSLPLARRIEAAEVRVARALVRANEALFPREESKIVELSGGIYSAMGPSANVAHVVGIGMGGTVEDEELDRLSALLESHQRGAEVHVSSLAEPTLVPRLLSRGFTAAGSEIVLAREVVPADRQWVSPAGYTIQGLHAGRAGEWCHALARGFFQELGLPGASDRPWRTTMQVDGFLGFLVYEALELAAVGGLLCAGDVARLFGHFTYERFRGRGLQRALIHHSLAVCAERGVTLVHFSALSEATATRNAERAGFTRAYTRTILERSAR